MLRRAHRRTTALLQTNIYALPFAPTTFDACVTYNGLHCLDDPPAAIAELTRVLTRSSATQAEPLITLMQHQGIFGTPSTTTTLRTWLRDASLTDIDLTPCAP